MPIVIRGFLILLPVIAMSFYLTVTTCKKFDIASDESIENILFYKDFRPKKMEPAPLPAQPLVLPQKPKQPECIPRMCCTMSCTNSCNPGDGMISPNQPMQSMMMPQPSRNSLNSLNPMDSMMSLAAMQSKRIPPINQHKNIKPPMMQFPSRKSFGSARDHIKSLIAKDEDIKKILKDLVRVTMKKVDLFEMINARRANVNENAGGANDDDNQEF